MHRWKKPLTRRTPFFLIGLTITFCFVFIADLSGDGSALFLASARAQEQTAAQPPAQPPPEQPNTEQPRQEAKPALMVAGKFTGINEPEGIKLVAETSDFKHLLQIAAIANKEVKDLRVEVAPFTGPNSVQSNIAWKVNNQAGDKSVTVPGLASVPLELSADLPIAGNYDSTIWLIYAEKRWPIKLTVTRMRAAPSVEVLGIETTLDTAFLPAENAYLWLTLHETAGKKATLNIPTLTSLALVQSDKSKLQAKYDCFQVNCLGEECKTENGFLVLNPGQTVHVQLTVVGLSDSGEFSGNLRVSSPDGDPIDKAVTILRRKSGWLAGLLIALGVAISFLLRHYASNVRPRLIRQREALALQQDIEELIRTHKSLIADEQDALDHLDRQARDLIEDIATARVVNAEQVIKDIKAKVEIFPRWVQERGRVDKLKPTELQQEFRDALNKIKDFMYEPTIKDEALKEAVKTLDNIAPQMKVKVREYWTTKTTDFKNELNALLKSSLSTVVKEDLTREVEPELKRVDAFLKDEKLDDAQTAYSKARLAYVRILSRELKSSLPETVPLGFDPPSWKQLKDKVISLLNAAESEAADPQRATDAYLQAYSTYLEGLIWKLQDRVKSKKESIDKDTNISPPDQIKFRGLLDSVALNLTQALTKINSGDMRGAAQDYEAATKGFVQVDTELKASGGTMAAAADASAPAAAGTATTIPGPFELPFLDLFTSHGRTPTVVELTQKLGVFDLIFTAIVLLIAVFLGLKLLWVGNLTWGGWDAYLSAVLWGLGLHQVSGVAFEGLQGLAAKFGPEVK